MTARNPTQTVRQKQNRLAVLILLILVPVSLVVADIGGVRSITASWMLQRAVAQKDATLGKAGLWVGGEDLPLIAEQLRNAVKSRQLDRLGFLLTIGGDPNITSSGGFTALYSSAYHNRFDMAALLVQHGADLELRSSKGWCPLSVAINRGHNRLAAMLIDAGADIESHPPDHIKKSPLWVAVGKGNLEMLELLLSLEVDTNVTIPDPSPDWRPTSVVDHALSKQRYGLARRLIRETGASRVNDRNVKSNPFISNYCLAGVRRELNRRKFAGQSRTDVNPITDAIEKQSDDHSVLALIDSHPHEVNRRDETGETPLLAATENNREVVVQRLIQQGADVNQPDGGGSTAIQLAAEEGHRSLFRLLIRAGVDPALSGCRDESLFYFLIHRRLIEPMKILVKEDVDLNMIDTLGTPLQIACSYGREPFIRVLLEAGANPRLAGGSAGFPAPVEYFRKEKPLNKFLTFVEQDEKGTL